MKSLKPLLIIPAMALSWSAQAVVTTTLPFPGPTDPTGATFGTALDQQGVSRDAILIDGIAVAFKYDEFWQYSAEALDSLQTSGDIPLEFGDFSVNGGVGNQDVKIFTQATGQQNPNGSLAGGFVFEEPAPTETGSQEPFFSSWWGQGDQNDDGTADTTEGPVTIGQVRDFIQLANPDNDIPVFMFDWNQTGAESLLFYGMNVELLVPGAGAASGFTIYDSWSLDANNNGAFDPTDPVLEDTSASLGSGFIDFFGYAEDMNLSRIINEYNLANGSGGEDLLFTVELRVGCPPGTDPLIGCNNDGAEEIFLTGRVDPTGRDPRIIDPPDIPEPMSFALFLTGLGWLGVSRRKLTRRG